MKRCLVIIVISIGATVLFAQNTERSCVNGSVLLIPSEADNKTEFTMVLYKSDLENITNVTTGKGEVAGYQIAFSFNQQYYSKSIGGSAFDQHIATKLKSCPTGTKVYFDQVIVKSTEGANFKGGYVVLMGK